MHGVTLPEGLQESQKFDKPVWTPSTKAEQGVKDENISPEEGKYFRCADSLREESVCGKITSVNAQTSCLHYKTNLS